MKTGTIAALLAIILLSGCGGARNWREEVKLADSSNVTVYRWAKLGNPLDQEIPDIKHGPPTVGYGIRIPQPGTGKTVTWETDRTLTPLAIGFRGDAIYLAARPFNCLAYDQLGRPVPPYVFFRHDGKDWQRIPVEEFPEEIRQTNLLVGSREQDVASGYITADDTAKNNRYLSPYLRNIDRNGVAGMRGCIRELEQLDKNLRK